MSFVHFTRLLGLPWHYLQELWDLKVLNLELWDLKVFTGANLVLRPASDSDSKLSDLKVFASNVKVNPVISWNGQNSFQRIFSESSQIFTTPKISFEFSDFYYTSNNFPVKPIIMNDRKTCPFREILSQRKGRGEHRVESNVDRGQPKIGCKSYDLNQSDSEQHSKLR